MANVQYYDVILKPVITEKSMADKEGVKEWQGNSKEVITSKNKALNDFIFASDLFRKVKEVEEEELKEEEKRQNSWYNF